MGRKEQTPAGGAAGVRCDSIAGPSHHPLSLEAQRAQFLVLTHAVRPDLAVMLAAAVFDGGAR